MFFQKVCKNDVVNGFYIERVWLHCKVVSLRTCWKTQWRNVLINLFNWATVTMYLLLVSTDCGWCRSWSTMCQTFDGKLSHIWQLYGRGLCRTVDSAKRHVRDFWTTILAHVFLRLTAVYWCSLLFAIVGFWCTVTVICLASKCSSAVSVSSTRSCSLWIYDGDNLCS